MKKIKLLLFYFVPVLVFSQDLNNDYEVSKSEAYNGVESKNLRYFTRGFGLVSGYQDFELVNNFYFNIEN